MIEMPKKDTVGLYMNDALKLKYWCEEVAEKPKKGQTEIVIPIKRYDQMYKVARQCARLGAVFREFVRVMLDNPEHYGELAMFVAQSWDRGRGKFFKLIVDEVPREEE